MWMIVDWIIQGCNIRWFCWSLDDLEKKTRRKGELREFIRKEIESYRAIIMIR
jgi:hypothetical protein